MADLTVLMIVHNRLEYLKKALPSVLNQDYKNFNLIIYDNGSNEETRKWLAEFKRDHLFSNVSIIPSKINRSLADVTTEIFNFCDTEFVGKVDADTIVPPNWASRLVEAHKKNHFGFIGGFHFRPEDLNEINPWITDFNGIKIWEKSHIGGCSFIIRRADFKGYKGDGVMGLSEYQAEMGLVNGYLWDPILYVEHMEDARSPHYIKTPEYNEYKIKTRGISLDTYQTSIFNWPYMLQNARRK